MDIIVTYRFGSKGNYWTTAKGERIEIKDLGTVHLKNIINYIKKHNIDTPLLLPLMEEYNSRNISSFNKGDVCISRRLRLKVLITEDSFNDTTFQAVVLEATNSRYSRGDHCRFHKKDFVVV